MLPRDDGLIYNPQVRPAVTGGSVVFSRYRETLPKMDEEEEAEIKAEIAGLTEEHRDLDQMIARVSEAAPFDQLQLQRMKKRKLMIKDQLSRLNAMLVPDIIA
ncbi:YdcH family protein [Pacificispira sp.]|uniref:YdcH family protein n=1 Tax=Pacificispira sp. TaxID=2888761 RepID=UPI003BACCA0D